MVWLLFVALDTCCWGLKATEIQGTQIQNIYNSTTIAFDSLSTPNSIFLIEVVLGWTPEQKDFYIYVFTCHC